jgi:MAP kinase substrate 1
MPAQYISSRAPSPISKQHGTTMSSAAAAKAKRGGVVLSLQGPGPGKRRRVAVVDGGGPRATAGPPVVVYEHTPKVIHARPDEFKALVQRLTGRAGGGGGGQEATVLRPAAAAAPSLQRTCGGGDPLVLTLGRQQQGPGPAVPLGDHHHHTQPAPPSPPSATGFLLSPGSFRLFSPATLQVIQELIS